MDSLSKISFKIPGKKFLLKIVKEGDLNEKYIQTTENKIYEQSLSYKDHGGTYNKKILDDAFSTIIYDSLDTMLDGEASEKLFVTECDEEPCTQ